MLDQSYLAERLPRGDGHRQDTEAEPTSTATVSCSLLVLPIGPGKSTAAGCPACRTGSAPQGRSLLRARPGAAERSGAALIEKYLMIIRQRLGYTSDHVR